MIDAEGSFPSQETVLELPSGRTVVVLNLIATVQQGSRGGRLGVQYRTTVPSTDLNARRAEAFEVISKFASFAEERGYSMSAQICNTLAAAEMQKGPERIFFFEQGEDRRWEYRGSVNSDGAQED